MGPEDDGARKPVATQGSSFVRGLGAFLAGVVTAAVALPAGMFGLLYFGGVHSDAQGRWFGPPLVAASFALLTAPVWVAVAVWRSLHKSTPANRRRS